MLIDWIGALHPDWTLLLEILAVLGWVIPVTMLFIVPANRRPSAATAWLLLMFVLPFLGALIFAVLGYTKLSKRRRAQQHTMDRLIAETIERVKAQDPQAVTVVDPPIPPRYQPFVRLAHSLGGLPAFAGNAVALFPDYDGAIEAIVEAIAQARWFVHVEYYILARDEATERLFAAMEAAVRRGVKVRVLLDHIGSRAYPGFQAMLTRMTDTGIDWHLMLPVRPFDGQYSRPDLRNHRKIVVVDRLVGFTGSQNMIDKQYHKASNLRRGLYYTELVARVTGPVVHQLDAAFISDWYSETGDILAGDAAPELHLDMQPTGDVLCQALPSGPGHDDENTLKLFAQLLHSARERIVIASPYFVPDEAIQVALTSAAQRGVAVTLLVSEIGDQFVVYHAQRSYYEQLLRAGVQVALYKSPALLHAKHLTIDDDIAVIGSSNLDIRSFRLNLEILLLCYDPRVVAEMQEVVAGYLRRAKPLVLSEWLARPFLVKSLDNLARLTSDLQ